MGDAEEDWAADMLYGAEPSAAPPTETVVTDEAEMPSDAMGPDEAVDLEAGDSLPGVEEPPDVNAGAKKTATGAWSTAAGVLAYFSDGIDLVLDGGPTPGCEASTVLDMTVEPPQILRQGAVIVRAPGHRGAGAPPS